MIISGAEPFFMQGGAHGVLLIHGFTGNPAELLLLGQHLHSKGFTVLGIRLAGHGTNEKDLSNMTKDDWQASVVDGYSILRGCCQKISVVGHSMGAILALNLSLLRNVERLVSLAAPIFIDESLRLQFLPPREESNDLYVRKRPRNLKNVPIAANRTYRLMPLISVHELMELIEDAKNIIKKVKVPLMVLHGKEDHTTKVESAEYIYENAASKQKRIELIDDMGHLLPLKEGREKVFEIAAKFLMGE